MQPRIKTVAETEAEPQEKLAPPSHALVKAVLTIHISTLLIVTLYSAFLIWMGAKPVSDSNGILQFVGIMMTVSTGGVLVAVIRDSDAIKMLFAIFTLIVTNLLYVAAA